MPTVIKQHHTSKPYDSRVSQAVINSKKHGMSYFMIYHTFGVKRTTVQRWIADYDSTHNIIPSCISHIGEHNPNTKITKRYRQMFLHNIIFNPF
jgi:hypothetical protein